jgi:hypothetical protein
MALQFVELDFCNKTVTSPNCLVQWRTDVVSNHDNFWHTVDDHNAWCNDPLSFEKRWGTKQWRDCVSSFFSTLTKVTFLPANCCFNSIYVTSHLQYRQIFAEELINNSCYHQEKVQYYLETHWSLRLLIGHDHELLRIQKWKFTMSTMQFSSIVVQRVWKECACLLWILTRNL